MTKIKHNKKRNTAFIYEALIRELATAFIKNDKELKGKIKEVFKEFFATPCVLRKELNLYRGIYESNNLSFPNAEKLIYESKKQYIKLNKKEIFSEQTRMINKLNKIFSADIFSNFVPNYKTLATINQIFNCDTTSPKTVVLLEEQLTNKLRKNSKKPAQDLKPLDDLVYKTFVEKFNDQYGQTLFEEQKRLLQKYIVSFDDNGVEMKLFLNEEVSRLKQCLTESLFREEVLQDLEMLNKTKEVLAVIEEFKNIQIDKEMLQRILKIQNLARELQF